MRSCFFFQDLATIISICDSLSENGYNFYALNSAAEYSLKGKRFDLSFSLFEKMKEKHLPLRAHYFWPILINLFNTDGVKGESFAFSKTCTMHCVSFFQIKKQNTYLYYCFKF
jgi:hypothetical protein